MREESKNYILKEFMAEETGVGVIELVLILVKNYLISYSL